jgi:6-phospho-beta-glucosidase
VKLTIVGGGGFRVPLVYRALLARADVGIDVLALHDADPQRLSVITRVLKDLRGPDGTGPSIEPSTDLRESLTGTDFVFCAVRVGGAAGRVSDERIALAHGALGQETIGPGGLAYGLRTVPEMVRIATVIADTVPRAWVINFTNPVGIVTEAMTAVLGDRVIGICDSPIALTRRVANALGRPPESMSFDYVGLNHLGWLLAARFGGTDLLPELLVDDVRLRTIEEGVLFGPDLLRSLGAIPNEYLHYFYDRESAVRSALASSKTRGEEIAADQERFYDAVSALGADGAGAADLWLAARRARDAGYLREARQAAGAGERSAEDLESGGYEQVALDLMAAIALDRPSTQILGVRNRGAVRALDDDAVVEVPCAVGAGGAAPLAIGDVPVHCAGLMLQVKATERDVIRAATRGDRRAFHRALATHPVVGSLAAARQLTDDYWTSDNAPATQATQGEHS